jgi:hypothetical protein
MALLRDIKPGKRENISERVNIHIQDEEIFIFQLTPDDEAEIRWMQRVVQDGMSSIYELKLSNTGRAR